MPLYPEFEYKVVEYCPDGSMKLLDSDGVYVVKKEGARSIPAEVAHTVVVRIFIENILPSYMPILHSSYKGIKADGKERFKIALGNYLKEYEFKYIKKSYYKETEELIIVIATQKSSFGDEYYINYGF
jgi:hypothetical protein